MKNLFYTSLLFAGGLLFTACSKDEGRDSADANFEYKINGIRISYDVNNALNGEGAYIAKQLGTTGLQTRYQVNAQKGLNDVWVSQIVTDSLVAGTYRFDSATAASGTGNVLTVMHAGSQATVYFDTDFIEFSITSHRNGRVDGTFRGKLTPMTGGLNYTNRGTVIISDGKIENLKVIY